MPVFDYACDACKKMRTQTISVHEEEFKPICDCGKTMYKIYSPIGVTFKGKGFYTTDKGTSSGNSKDN
jgi:putative FmdB family regulatory protein